MTSFLPSGLSPVPSFAAYTGRYSVGTQDVEIPISHLPTGCPPPDASITTLSFRIFYPCQPNPSRSKPVYWLPRPQDGFLRAYARFLSAGPRLASFISYLPILRLVCHTTIPASQDAQLLLPPAEIGGRWPVMIFSHGLGGTRNAYSHLVGSLASHGLVVVAPEHRDGSAPVSYIHSFDGVSAKAVDYRALPHKPSPELGESRNKQLEIRLWELGLTYEALLKLDSSPAKLHNICAPASPGSDSLGMFASALDVHTPGKISWSGHSFGAASVVQFIKSVYYHDSQPPNGYEPLYTPPPASSLVSQITPSTPISLLDLWTLPLLSPPTSYLWSKPLPAHHSKDGSPPLVILSEAFFKWTRNLQKTKRVLSFPTGGGAESPARPRAINNNPPHIFYPVHSAHLSQSDFGPLFPWITKKAFKAEDPQRTLRLNVRAILESLRRSGVKVADTSASDMELLDRPTKENDGFAAAGSSSKRDGIDAFPLAQDHGILATDGSIKGWIAVPPLLDDDDDDDVYAGLIAHAPVAVEAERPSDAVVKGEVMKR